MDTNLNIPPLWLMGLSNTTLGLITGIAFLAVPQLLAAERVQEWRIAAITAMAMSQTFGLSCSARWLTCGSVPVTYMMVADGRAYSLGGVTGTLAVDASISIAACLLMGLLLSKLDRKPSKPAVERVSLAGELPQ